MGCRLINLHHDNCGCGFMLRIESNKFLLKDGERVQGNSYLKKFCIVDFRRLIDGEGLNGWKIKNINKDNSDIVCQDCVVCENLARGEILYFKSDRYSTGFMIHDKCAEELTRCLESFIKENQDNILTSII